MLANGILIDGIVRILDKSLEEALVLVLHWKLLVILEILQSTTRRVLVGRRRIK
jgi:hypothetical protein